MNSYADIGTFKSADWANISSNTEQVRFRRLLESASQYIEKRTERKYFCWEGAKYYDGAGWLPVDDLLSVTALKLDEDGDATFGETMAATDYILYPLNEFPKTWIEISSNSDYGTFASGTKKGVEIEGIHGYGDGYSATPYHDSGIDINVGGGINTTVTTVTVDDGTKFGAGHTIRIDSEQIYVESISTHILTIQRGVNGTTAATHADDASIYIYDYPQLIWQATMILAMKAWKRKDSAFQNVVGNPDTGLVVTFKDEDPAIKNIIDRYRRRV